MRTTDADWCRWMMRSLALGGVWGVPRSGLTFTKTAEDTLTLTSKVAMAMPGFSEFQDDDYAVIKQKFEEAGYKVNRDDG
jgi:hypothetical protein